MTIIQHKRGLATNWTTQDPVLAVSEIGYETDTGKFKIGDGTSVWSALPYFSTSAGGSGTVTSITAGTGLSGGTITTSGTIALSHLGIESLTDPNADRILFWDDSASSAQWLTLGSNLSISGTTINATDTNTTYTAGTGLTLSGTEFSVTANTYQPLDSDLTAIAALSADGLLRKTSGTWGMDSSTYLTSLGIGSSTQAWDADLDAVAALSGTGLAKRTGSGTWTTITDNSTNWDSAYTDRLKWDGGSTGLTASTGRTSLGATTVGSNLFTLANPSVTTFLKINSDNSITTESASVHRASLGGTTVGENLFTLTNPSELTFLRLNADNTVTARSAANFRSDIGAGTGNGTVTTVSVASANGFAGTVANDSTTPAITISTSITGLLSGNGTAISAASVGYGDTTNPYGSKTTNYVLAGPAGGPSANPSFRALVSADIPDLSGTYAALSGATFSGQIQSTHASTWSSPAIIIGGAQGAILIKDTDASQADAIVGTNAGSFFILGDTASDGTFDTTPFSINLTSGAATVLGDLAVNGGDLTTTATGTATLFNTNATTLNIGGAASTAVNIGNANGAINFAGAVDLRAGGAGAGTAPLYFSSSSSVLTTPVAGAMEYNNTALYFTPDTTPGRALVSTPFYKIVSTTEPTISLAGGTAGTLSAFGTNGIALDTGTAYEIEMLLLVSSAASSNSCTLVVTPGSPSGAATPSSTELYYDYSSSTTVISNAAATSAVLRTGTTTFPALNTITVATGTTNYLKAFMKGIVDIGTGGNFTIRLAYTPGAGGSLVGTVLKGSYLKITPIGSEDVSEIGTWA